MRVYSQEEVIDHCIGLKGTPLRKRFEAELMATYVGVFICNEREDRHLTQAQLGKMVGVSRSKISQIERGEGLSLILLARIMQELGIDFKTVFSEGEESKEIKLG